MTEWKYRFFIVEIENFAFFISYVIKGLDSTASSIKYCKLDTVTLTTLYEKQRKIMLIIIPKTHNISLYS